MTLPTPSPEQTATDLRSAAQLVQEYGKASLDYVDPRGRVCAAGAVGLATGLFARKLDPRSGTWGVSSHSTCSSQLRFIAALSALAPLLPISPCDGSCRPLNSLLPLEQHHAKIASNPEDTVFHFNDYVCEGGLALTAVLVQAAEKIEANLP